MTRETLQQKLDELNVWKRGDERAPHKPMLLLLAMGRAVRGEERLVSFREIEAPLTDLLRHFGPPRRAYHPEFAPRGGCGHFPEPVGIAASREASRSRTRIRRFEATVLSLHQQRITLSSCSCPGAFSTPCTPCSLRILSRRPRRPALLLRRLPQSLLLSPRPRARRRHLPLLCPSRWRSPRPLPPLPQWPSCRLAIGRSRLSRLLRNKPVRRSVGRDRSRCAAPDCVICGRGVFGPGAAGGAAGCHRTTPAASPSGK